MSDDRGYALLDVLVWTCIAAVVLMTVSMSMANLSRQVKQSMDSMSAIGGLVIVDMSIMRDLDRGPDVVVMDNKINVNGAAYQCTDNKLYRNGRVMVKGVTRLNATLDVDGLHVVIEAGGYRLDRTYYMGGVSNVN